MTVYAIIVTIVLVAVIVLLIKSVLGNADMQADYYKQKRELDILTATREGAKNDIENHIKNDKLPTNIDDILNDMDEREKHYKRKRKGRRHRNKS